MTDGRTDPDVMDYLPLAASIARSYATEQLPFEDLVQEGLIGLTIAAHRYDPSRGAFATYARHWVKASIHRCAAASGHLGFAIPERVFNEMITAKRALSEIEQETGGAATDGELEARGLDASRVRSLVALSRACESLQRPVGDGSHELGDLLAPPEEYGGTADVSELSEVFQALDDESARLVRLRYGLDDGFELSVSEIAHRAGLRPKYISMRLAASIKVMKERARQLADAERQANIRENPRIRDFRLVQRYAAPRPKG